MFNVFKEECVLCNKKHFSRTQRICKKCRDKFNNFKK